MIGKAPNSAFFFMGYLRATKKGDTAPGTMRPQGVEEKIAPGLEEPGVVGRRPGRRSGFDGSTEGFGSVRGNDPSTSA